MNQICDISCCTACSACMNVCPQNAIKMQGDDVGYLFPIVDQVKCIDCGVCVKICPVNFPVQLQIPLKRFVGYADSMDEQFPSTSGGIASAVCRYVISQGGVAYGSTAMNYRDVHHMRVENENQLDEIRGSKYVQSSIGDVYKQIKDDLKTRRVAFVGAPCQVAGLNKYLRKPYNNLITIDFVCHGVPCNNILIEAVKDYCVEDKAQSVAFRKKKNKGKTVYGMFIRNAKGQKLVDKAFPKDAYITGFLTALYYRPSCYVCQYAQINRCSDLTLGDYKETYQKTSLPSQKSYGMSMILVNTAKGNAMLNELQKLLRIEESNEAFENNGQLNHCMSRHKNYNAFRRDFLLHGWPSAAQHFIIPEQKRVCRRMFVSKIRDFIYLIPGVDALYHTIKKYWSAISRTILKI